MPIEGMLRTALLLAVVAVVAVLAAGCRADEGEACAKEGDCQEDLLCHERTCRTRQQIAQIQYKRGEAAWRDTRGRIVGQVSELQKRMDELEKELSGAKSDAERESIQEQLRKLREMNADDEPVQAPPVTSPP